jgi:hypothetical protein
MLQVEWRMSGGEVLGTTLIAWLKKEGDDIGIARRAVEEVCPRVCPGRAQVHPDGQRRVKHQNEVKSHQGN